MASRSLLRLSQLTCFLENEIALFSSKLAMKLLVVALLSSIERQERR